MNDILIIAREAWPGKLLTPLEDNEMIDFKLQDKIDNLPLSLAVKPLVKHPEEPLLKVEQFLVEQTHEALQNHPSKY